MATRSGPLPSAKEPPCRWLPRPSPHSTLPAVGEASCDPCLHRVPPAGAMNVACASLVLATRMLSLLAPGPWQHPPIHAGGGLQQAQVQVSGWGRNGAVHSNG